MYVCMYVDGDELIRGDGINTTSSKEWLDEPGYRKRRRVDSDIGGVRTVT